MIEDSHQTQPNVNQVSLYPLILNEAQHHLLTGSVETLVAISHSIEETVMQHHLQGTFYAGFQRTSAFLPQINRFARLAAICGEVLVFVYQDTAVPEMPGVKFVFLDQGAPLADEWFIIFATPALQIALLTRQLSSKAGLNPTAPPAATQFGRGRAYQGIVTLQPELLVTARKTLDQALDRSSPNFLEDLIQSRQFEPEHPVFTFSRRLTDYLEERNRELAGLYRTLTARTEAIERLQARIRILISQTAWQQAREEEEVDAVPSPPLAQEHNLTVLFSDIEGFTTLSEARLGP